MNRINYLETIKKEENKLKDYQEIKENQKNFDCLILEIDLKNTQISKLLSDKKKYELSINKLYEELNSEREKLRSIEFDKKKLEYEIHDLNGMIGRLQNQNHKKSLKINQFNNDNDSNNEADKRLCSFNINNDEEDENSKNVDKIEVMRICVEQSEKLTQLLFENDEIIEKYEKNKQILEISLKEKEELINENKDLKQEKNNIIDNINFLQDKLISEREKFSLILKEKFLLIKEIETIKRQSINQTAYIYQIEKENKVYSNMNKSLELQIEKDKLDNMTINNHRISSLKETEEQAQLIPMHSHPTLLSVNKSSVNNDYNSEICKLRDEILFIKKEKYEIQISRNEEIQSLKNQVLIINVKASYL